MSELAKRIGIEPGEGRIFACAAGVLFLVGWASVQLTNVSETLFLKRVGVEYLPLAFLGNSVLLIASTWITGWVAARTDQVRFMIWTLVGLAIALVPLWIALGTDAASVATALVIAAKQMDSIALLVFWVAVGGLLHGRQAKRLYAPITAGATLGTIVGSFASGPIGRFFGIGSLVPIAAVGLLCAAVAALPLRRLAATPRLATDHTPQAARERAAAEPARTATLWRESLLFRVLIVSAGLSGILGPMLYFQFSYVADLATQGGDGEQRLLDLYSQFRGWLNFGVLVLQLTGSSRLYSRIGVPLASLLSPLVYVLGFLGLSVRLSLPAGIGAVALTSVQDHAIYDPAQKVLLTLFDERARATVTALTDGAMKRAGGVLGNLLVLGALHVGTPIWIGWAALPIAGLWLALAIVLWRAYPNLLMEVVSARGASAAGALDDLPLGDLIDAGTLRVLQASLTDADLARCQAACAMLREAPPDRAAGALLHALPHAPLPNRPLIVAALARLLREHRNLLPIPTDGVTGLEPLLADPHAAGTRERAHLVHVYAALSGPLRSLELLARLTDDTTAPVRLAATVALHVARGEEVDAALAGAMTESDATVREVARLELAALLARTDPGDAPDQRWRDRLALLTTALDRPEDRPGTAAVLADLAARHGTRLADHGALVMSHGQDPDSRVRTSILRFVGHTRLAGQAGWLVERLTARDEREAAAASDALRSIAPLAVDLLLHALHFGKRSTRRALLPILREMPVDERSLRGLVDSELDYMQRTLGQLRALGAGRVSDLVLQRLRERVAESAHTTLLLLAALLDEDRIARLCRLLERTPPDGRAHAVLLEALEALLPPDDRARVMRVLENRESAGTPGERPVSFEQALRDIFAGDDPLSRSFLRATLDVETRARLDFEVHADASPAEPGRATETAFDDGDGDIPNAGTEGQVLNKVEVVLHLRSLDLFERLTTRQLSDLAAVVREQTHAPGDAIVREGDLDDCMYLIVAGQIRITTAGRFLADLGPRNFFGEMTVFDGETRSATATATSPVRLLRLERHDLFLVMEEQPGIAIAICQTLSRRLRDLNERVRG